jgi:putative tryptophan/tyrosine transport system substrate-binding protein
LLGAEGGGLFWATSLEKIIGGVIALISFRLTWDVGRGMDAAVSCRSEVGYPFGRKHGRYWAVKRREFITLLGGAAAAWPLAAQAQRLSVPVIGFLDVTTAADTIYRPSAFSDGLKEAGFIEGHNVAIEFRWAENKFDRLPALAADLVQRQVAVIVGPNTAMLAVRTATSTIPIVFVSGGDPIESGVTNLSRPGGNITGVSFASTALEPKRLGLLHELVPPPSAIAWLRDPRDPSFEGREKEVPSAARELGRQLLALNAQSVGEIDAAFATIVQSRAGALLIGNSILFSNRRRQLAALAARHGVPAIGGIREFVLAGGLMSYGASDTDAYRRAGSHYVAPILRGTKPGDLPVEMPIKYELVISVVAPGRSASTCRQSCSRSPTR